MIQPLAVPPAIAVGAMYDSVLQSALRQFFERASLDTEVTPSVSSDGRLSIEPSANPAALIIRWFGTRYTLRVPPRWPFTAHEVRLAQAIGAVLAVRYSAILNPRIIAERNDLFRGFIEDRYVGAFLDHRPYAIEAREAKADRIASVIELLRVAALSSYENRPISTGVVLLGTSNDPCRPDTPLPPTAPSYTESTTAIKSLFRLADGERTVFLANSEGRLLDIIDIERWATQVNRHQALQVPCAKAYQPHARATLQQGHVCAVLSPSREIKIFAEGAEIFTFRGAAWHLLDLQAKYKQWADAVGDEALAMRIVSTSRMTRPDVPARRHAAICSSCSRADRSPISIPTCSRRSPRSTARSSLIRTRGCSPPARSCVIRLLQSWKQASWRVRARRRRSPPASSVRFSKSVRTGSSLSSTVKRSGTSSGRDNRAAGGDSTSDVPRIQANAIY
jgi:hypothetical protein